MEYYGKERYVSVWIGQCEKEELFNDYIGLRYINDDFCFELGNDFGICSYDDDFSLVRYSEQKTKDLKILLDTGVTKHVIRYFVWKKGRFLKEEFNCCVMYGDMKYTGKVREVMNKKYGKFVYLGSMALGVFDMF